MCDLIHPNRTVTYIFLFTIVFDTSIPSKHGTSFKSKQASTTHNTFTLFFLHQIFTLMISLKSFIVLIIA